MLDIPESEMGEAMKLVLWRQMVLRVTIEPESVTNRNNETEKEPERNTAQMDSRRIAIRRDK